MKTLTVRAKILLCLAPVAFIAIAALLWPRPLSDRLGFTDKTEIVHITLTVSDADGMRDYQIEDKAQLSSLGAAFRTEKCRFSGLYSAISYERPLFSLYLSAIDAKELPAPSLSVDSHGYFYINGKRYRGDTELYFHLMELAENGATQGATAPDDDVLSQSPPSTTEEIDLLMQVLEEDEMPLKELFQLSTVVEGAYAEVFAGRLYREFSADPQGFFEALAGVQELPRAMSAGLLAVAGNEHQPEFDALLSSLTAETPGQQAVLATIAEVQAQLEE